jgi:2-polyprenyl-6-methoxyphenol hydroxylase-like FAD-dependent oxidoreductase
MDIPTALSIVERADQILDPLKSLEAISDPLYMEAKKFLEENDPYHMYMANPQSYLQSALWRKIRRRVLKRDRNTCVRCGCKATQVHHRSYEPEAVTTASSSVSANHAMRTSRKTREV